MRRIAYYGGTFDPPHRGHLAISHALLEQFKLDEFVFVPAFHAPHKVRLNPTSAYDRYAMLCLITENEPKLRVSKMEIESPEHPYSVETLSRINAERPLDDLYFVIGADSWMDILTWREWEKVLTITNVIVVVRPDVEIRSSHVTKNIRKRIIDLRSPYNTIQKNSRGNDHIYITDAVSIDVSASMIRGRIRNNDLLWRSYVPREVANYIEKYQIYK